MVRPGFVELLPPFILPRTTRAASTCLSSSAKLVLAARNFDTNSDSPTKSAMSTPTRILMRANCKAGEGLAAVGGRFGAEWLAVD
jgi:hypothetical protein